MTRKFRRLCSAALAGGVMASAASAACAQVATLDKGHSLLINNGLQIWGLNTDSFQYNFNYQNFLNANLNAVVWSYGQDNSGALSDGQKWGKWVDYTGSPLTATSGDSHL